MSGSKQVFTGISPLAWEHPADKAAMSALHGIPGLDMIVGKILGATVDRYVRLQFLSSAVRVGDRQFSRVRTLVKDMSAVLDSPLDYECFVTYNPAANAGVYGFQRPVIVFHSSLLEIMDDEELSFVVAHELGHAASGHALYHTLLRLLVDGWQLLSGMGLSDIARIALILALLEWSRTSELSADRAGLLGVQDANVVWRAFMKMAGGSDISQMNIDDFLQQSLDYEKGGNVADELSKLMLISFRTHPMPVLRLKELKLWHDAGAYRTILAGDYGRRTEKTSGSTAGEKERTAGADDTGRSGHGSNSARDSNVLHDLGEAFKHYGTEFANSNLVKGLGEGLGKAFRDLDDFFKGSKKE